MEHGLDNAKTTERDRGQVGSAVDELQRQVDQIEKSAAVLYQRLVSVIRPSDSPPTGGESPSPVRVPLAERLVKISDQVAALSNSLAHLTDSIEL